MNYILKCTFENKVFIFNRNILILQKFVPQNIKTFWGLSDELCLEKMNIELITSMPGDNKNLCDQKWLNEIKKEYISEIENEDFQMRDKFNKEAILEHQMSVQQGKIEELVCRWMTLFRLLPVI